MLHYLSMTEIMPCKNSVTKVSDNLNKNIKLITTLLDISYILHCQRNKRKLYLKKVTRPYWTWEEPSTQVVSLLPYFFHTTFLLVSFTKWNLITINNLSWSLWLAACYQCITSWRIWLEKIRTIFNLTSWSQSLWFWKRIFCWSICIICLFACWFNFSVFRRFIRFQIWSRQSFSSFSKFITIFFTNYYTTIRWWYRWFISLIQAYVATWRRRFIEEGTSVTWPFCLLPGCCFIIPSFNPSK